MCRSIHHLPQCHPLTQRTLLISLAFIIAGLCVNPLLNAQPIQIGSLQDLLKIGNDPNYPLDGSYELTQDIDGENQEISPLADNDIAGYDPNKQFTGVFDGKGYKIKNLKIADLNGGSGTEKYDTGLFGVVSGTVKNLILENIEVQGRYRVGSLVGSILSGGKVEYCAVINGTVSGTGNNVAGLVGQNNGGTIEHCMAMASVSITRSEGSTFNAGVLVGTNTPGAFLRYSYSVGNLNSDGTALGTSRVGGLIGYINQATVENCYSWSNITMSGTGTGYAGGLVGVIDGASAVLTNGYSIGTINRDSMPGCTIGGLVASLLGGTITSSYWDIDASGINTSAGGVGKTTAEMKTQSTFVGWDFTPGTGIWGMQENITYPLLRKLDYPIINLIGNSEITIECGSNYSDPGATAIDGIDGDLTSQISVNNPVNTAVVGEYLVRYTVTDSDNNTIIAVRTVKVQDNSAPEITLNGNNPLIVECRTSFTDPGASAEDTCEGPVPVQVSGSVNVNEVGEYTLTYTATDSNANSAQVQRIVKVEDNPPQIIVTGPDPATTTGEPVRYTVRYIAVSEVTLSPRDVELRVRNGRVTANIAVNRIDGKADVDEEYEIILSDFEGNGEVAIAIKPGTAVDGGGNYAGEYVGDYLLTVNAGWGVPIATHIGLIGLFLIAIFGYFAYSMARRRHA